MAPPNMLVLFAFAGDALGFFAGDTALCMTGGSSGLDSTDISTSKSVSRMPGDGEGENDGWRSGALQSGAVG